MAHRCAQHLIICAEHLRTCENTTENYPRQNSRGFQRLLRMSVMAPALSGGTSPLCFLPPCYRELTDRQCADSSLAPCLPCACWLPPRPRHIVSDFIPRGRSSFSRSPRAPTASSGWRRPTVSIDTTDSIT